MCLSTIPTHRCGCQNLAASATERCSFRTQINGLLTQIFNRAHPRAERWLKRWRCNASALLKSGFVTSLRFVRFVGNCRLRRKGGFEIFGLAVAFKGWLFFDGILWLRRSLKAWYFGDCLMSDLEA